MFLSIGKQGWVKIIVGITLVTGIGYWWSVRISQTVLYGSPPIGEIESSVPNETELNRFFTNWSRPDGPLRVGLQAGHWENDELPDELHKLRGTSTGASSGGIEEWVVVLRIAEITKELLEEQGLVVDLIPATIPPRYYADAFVSIHADGNKDRSTRGFKTAPPWRDFSGRSRTLNEKLENSYSSRVGFVKDPMITRNMRGYYAFSWWRYNHALHPMTPAVIIETGFLTNPAEARLLSQNPELPALAIAEGILEFLTEELH